MLRKTRSGVSAPARSERQRLEDLASELVHQNDELREEIRQTRAAIGLWANIAASTCLRCAHRLTAEDLDRCGKTDCSRDLAEIANALRSLSGPAEEGSISNSWVQ